MGPDDVLSSVFGAVISAVAGSIKSWYVNHFKPVKVEACLDEMPPYALGLADERVAMERICSFPGHELLADENTIWIDKATIVIDISNMSDYEVSVTDISLRKRRTDKVVNFAVQYIPQGANLPREFLVLLDDGASHIDECERTSGDGKLRVTVRDYFGRRHARVVVAPHESERVMLTVGTLSGSWKIQPTLEIKSPYGKKNVPLLQHPVQIVAGNSIPDANKYWTLGVRFDVWGTGFYMPNLEIPIPNSSGASSEPTN